MKVISIANARKIALAVHGFLQATALKEFGSTGDVKPGLANEVRRLDALKATLKTERKINDKEYWQIVDLDRFINHHLDSGFSDLRKAYSKATATASATA